MPARKQLLGGFEDFFDGLVRMPRKYGSEICWRFVRSFLQHAAELGSFPSVLIFLIFVCPDFRLAPMTRRTAIWLVL